MKQKIGIYSIFLLCFIPAFLWILMMPLADRFGNINATFKSLGQLTGLVGMTLYAISLILSARWKFIENYFSGLNQIYKKHHLIGGISLILLLFHPLFLTFNYLNISAFSAFQFLLGQTQEGVFWGDYALGLMIVLLILTFYLRPIYRIWIITHKFLNLVFVFIFLHFVYISSDISNNQFLRFYLLALILFAFISIIYRTFIFKSPVKENIDNNL